MINLVKKTSRILKDGDIHTYLYLIIPFLIFFCSWFKWYVYILILILFFLSMKKVIKVKLQNSISKSVLEYNKKDILAFVLILAWVYLSGIGGFVYQNGDWSKHNVIIAELINNDWPVIVRFEDAGLANIIRTLGESNSALMIYYIGYYLPSVAVAKLFSSNAILVVRIALYIWTVIGIFFVYRELKYIFKKNALLALIIFIFFSGADIVAYKFFSFIGMLPKCSSLTHHIESWLYHLKYFTAQYSSNTTQLFWVPNQAIAGWLITLKIYRHKNDFATVILFIGLSILFSPFVFIGLLPYALYLFLKMISQKKRFILLKDAVLDIRAWTGIIFAVMVGLFLFSNQSKDMASGMGFYLNIKSPFLIKKLIILIIFYTTEFLTFIILLVLNNKQNKDIIDDKVFFLLTIILLFIFPIIGYGAFNDLSMRASIPILVFLFIYVSKMLFAASVNKTSKILKIFLIIVLLFGSITPICEMNRSTKYDMEENNIELSDKTSLFDIERSLVAQYFDFSPKNNMFYKYLLKDAGINLDDIIYSQIDISNIKYELSSDKPNDIKYKNEDDIIELNIASPQNVKLTTKIILEKGVYVIDIPVDRIEVSHGKQSEYFHTKITDIEKTYAPLKSSITRKLSFYLEERKEIELVIFANETSNTVGSITLKRPVLKKVD